MVTGDNINTAKAIARECGILTEGGVAIEGPDFRLKGEEELHELIPKIQVSLSMYYLPLPTISELICHCALISWVR
jgi:hypothetical protein